MSQPPRAYGNIAFDPCGAFFVVLGGSFASVMAAAIVMSVANMQTTTELFILFSTAILMAVAFMMNIAEPKPSAKEVFWGWIIAMIAFAAMAGWGLFVLTVFGVTTIPT